MAQNKNQGSGQGGKMSREEAGRKGGEAVSQDREHMADIGRKGGQHSQSGGRSGGSSGNQNQQGQQGQQGGGGNKR